MAESMPGQRRRRWPGIESAMAQRLVSARSLASLRSVILINCRLDPLHPSCFIVIGVMCSRHSLINGGVVCGTLRVISRGILYCTKSTITWIKYDILPSNNDRVAQLVTWRDQPIKSVIQLLFKLWGRMPYSGRLFLTKDSTHPSCPKVMFSWYCPSSRLDSLPSTL